MPPKLNASQDDLELFCSRLENIIDQRHPLVSNYIFGRNSSEERRFLRA